MFLVTSLDVPLARHSTAPSNVLPVVLTVRPAVVLQNCLPYPIQIRLLRELDYIVGTVDLEVGQSAPLVCLNASTMHWLQVHIPGYKWSLSAPVIPSSAAGSSPNGGSSASGKDCDDLGCIGVAGVEEKG